MERPRAILIGADDAGVELLEVIARDLAERGVAVETVRPDDLAPEATGADGAETGSGNDAQIDGDAAIDYPDVAARVAFAIRDGLADRAILICGTGIGMAITANKVPGVRAALAHDVYSAERARKSNDAQILTLGARVIGPESAKTIVHAWLESDFAGGASARKVGKIEALERRLAADSPSVPEGA